MPGTLQNYTYTDASGRLVQGTRWLGQDGLWHGDHAETSQDAGGSSTVVSHRYARNPMASGSQNQPRTSVGRPPAQPQYRPQYQQPSSYRPQSQQPGSIARNTGLDDLTGPGEAVVARGLTGMAVSLSGSSSTASWAPPSRSTIRSPDGGPSLPLVERRPAGL